MYRFSEKKKCQLKRKPQIEHGKDKPRAGSGGTVLGVCNSAPGACRCTVYEDIDLPGDDLVFCMDDDCNKGNVVESAQICRMRCSQELSCNAYSFDSSSRICYLKKKDPHKAFETSKKAVGVNSAVCICEGVVKCMDGDVRVAEGSSLEEGAEVMAEVHHNGDWYPMCSFGFADDDNGATTVCKKLGFHKGRAVPKLYESVVFPAAAMPIGRCAPGEALTRCSRGNNGWGNFDSGPGSAECKAGKQVAV